MASLLRKLDEILEDKYKLKKSVKRDVEILKTELTSMHAALGNVAEVPREQLQEHVKLWDQQAKGLWQRTEGVVDTFQARILGSEGSTSPDSFKRLTKKMDELFRRDQPRRQIACSIKHIKDEVQDLANRNGWYREWCKVEAVPASINLDPRMETLYRESAELVGVHEKTKELIKLLAVEGDKMSKTELITVSILGFGGSGKTSLAKAVYHKIKGDFECTVFVSVGQNPDIKKVLMDILFNLYKQMSAGSNPETLDVHQLIAELRKFLQDKRYLAVIDDLWTVRTWETIKCAFPDGNLGSRLITTSRIASLSRVCCSCSEDSVYEMEPLNYDDSKRLFYKRLGFEGNDYPQEFKQVSDEILRKCGGLPLAIITVASLLHGHQRIKSVDEWQIVLEYISGVPTEESSMDKFRRILSLSYDDLPSHLKSCLLYLSVFPEDYEIEIDRLIRRWIAEGLIQSKSGVSLFEVGESYFHELINRSMIQPRNINFEGRVEFCQVHDVMLDFMRSLSSEDNFVTVLNEQSTSNPQSRIRRLSLQNSLAESITDWLATTSMLQVRSVTVFGPAVSVMPSLSCFQALRVLDLEDSDLSESYHKINLSCVGSLLHLRYLGLKDTNVGELLMEMGNLQFLQTLCVRGNGIKELPQSAIKLRCLMFLHIEGGTTLPVGARNLTSLEELNKLQVSPNIVKELGYLIELRVLVIYWGELGMSQHKTLVESLSNLHKLQSLKIESWGGHIDLMREGWCPTRHLRRFESCGASFSTMPRWISTLFNLSHLAIYVDKVQPEDIQILGVLPALRSIILNVTGCIEKATVEGFMVSTDAFPSLKQCCFNNFVTMPSMFPGGAMQNLQFLQFSLRACDVSSSNLDFGMGHLPSLERVHVDLWCQDLWCQEASTTELEEIEAALRHAAETHPNRPAIDIHFGVTVSGSEHYRGCTDFGSHPEGTQQTAMTHANSTRP